MGNSNQFPPNERLSTRMTLFTLVRRSLRFHARSHLGVLLGAIVGSAALVGALVVGDSVRGSLRDMALLRLGNVDLALSGGDRIFRDELANDLAIARVAPWPESEYGSKPVPEKKLLK